MSDTQKWMESLFVEEVTRPPGDQLRDHDRDTYNRLALAARMGSDRVSEFEFQVMEAIFDDALNEILLEEAEYKKPHWNKAIFAIAAIFLIGISAYFAVIFERQADDGFQARSAVLDSIALNPSRLLAYCAVRHSGEIQFHQLGLDRSNCGINDEIKLAYTSESPRHSWGYFFGVSESGSVYWYGPSPADKTPVALQQSEEPTPIGESIRLSVNHSPGLVKVVGVFSERRIDWESHKIWVEQVAAPAVWRGDPLLLDHGTSSVAEFKVEGE